MTVYERVLAATKPFGLPTAPQSYTGPADTYLVFDSQITDTVDGDDAPVFAYYQVTLSLFSPVRKDTVELCEAIQQAIHGAKFSFPVVTPGGLSLDGARKCQRFSFGRWDDWQPSTSMT